MTDLSIKEIELVKLLAESNPLLSKLTKQQKSYIDSQIGIILRKYFEENTMGLEPDITNKFRRAGISEEDGKTAISAARRIGIKFF